MQAVTRIELIKLSQRILQANSQSKKEFDVCVELSVTLAESVLLFLDEDNKG